MSFVIAVVVPFVTCSWILIEFGCDPGGQKEWLIARAARLIWRALA